MPNGTRTLKYRHDTCQCADRGCPMHLNVSDCDGAQEYRCTRVDMENAHVMMCEGCADDAAETGLFTIEAV